MEELEGKVAVVTGAASGIGLAVARRALAAGMKVVLADIEEAPLAAAAAELTGTGGEVSAQRTDVSDMDSVTALREHAVERFGTVHLVHNNAGVGGSGGPLWRIPLADWRWTLNVNLWGVVHGLLAFVPLLVEQGEGHVVNTASIAGLTSPPELAPYNASKHAVVAISETLFKDLALADSPVGVSVLCPGFVRTGIAHSDRNRPDWAPPPPPSRDGGESMADMIGELVAGGFDPDVIAAAVLEAVRQHTFYILTHPESDAMVGSRMHDILERRLPRVRRVS